MELEMGEWTEHESREYGNRSSGSVVGREFVGLLSDCQLVEQNSAL
jgi:hypothetical protein